MVLDGLSSSLLANAILAGAYVLYKAINRCINSKCRYNKDEGLTFDLDNPTEQSDPFAELQQLAELIQARATHHRKANTIRNLDPATTSMGYAEAAAVV